MACPHCLKLSAKVEAQRLLIAHLQRELGLRHANGALGAMMDALGVSPTEALILGVLRAAGGRYVATEMLVEGSGVPDDINLRAHVYGLRKKVGCESVLTLHRCGYALSESGLGLVDSAMRVDCT